MSVPPQSFDRLLFLFSLAHAHQGHLLRSRVQIDRDTIPRRPGSA